MTPLLFTEAQLNAIATQAKAALPAAVNGRLEKAVRLVRSGSVELHEDGSAVVISESDGLTGYLIANGRCNCPDFQFQPAEVEGWCCHKIARALVLRLQRHTGTPSNGTLTPHAHDKETGSVKNGCAEPSQNFDTTLPVVVALESISSSPLPEAPASVNCYILIGGRQAQLTLRDTDEARLLVRLETVLQRYPLEQATLVQSAAAVRPAVAPVCQWHGAMKESTKVPGTWYCPAKMADNTYCKERHRG